VHVSVSAIVICLPNVILNFRCVVCRSCQVLLRPVLKNIKLGGKLASLAPMLLQSVNGITRCYTIFAF